MDSCMSNFTTEPGREPGRSPRREPSHSESDLDHSASQTGRSPSRPEPGRAPGRPETASSAPGSYMVPRWLEVQFEKLFECETEEEFWDSDNPRFGRTDVIDQRITLASVRDKPSDHIKASYAIIGFRCDSLGYGQFKIGGNAARQAMRMRDTEMLPVELVLRHKYTKSGRDFYWWEYP
jgi:hypothetical protein